MESTEHRSEKHRAQIAQLFAEMNKVVVGQATMINRLLVGLFTNGHVLLEGVPGLAKTLTVNTLAQALQLQFRRIQFTPDLLPADLIGTMIYNQKEGIFEVKKGPIFANLILADEINRSPAKVQSALLEAMQEKQVTIGETSFPLDQPFLVLATQNPVDQEGTYPLPEAQVDRFMLKISIGYPTKSEETEMMRRISNLDFNYTVNTVLTRESLAEIRSEVNQIKIAESLERYIIELVSATRKPKDYTLDREADYIQFGASPRASINIHRASKAIAYLHGRNFVLPEDIKEIAPDVLSHRIVLNYEAEADSLTARDIVATILNKIPITQ